MKNRAKCKLCQSIIESFHHSDYVTCKCGEISIDGGQHHYSASAKDWRNFLRVDDMENEIIVEVVDSPHDQVKKSCEENIKTFEKPSKQTLLKMLEDLIESFEKMPPAALHSSATLQDLYSVLILVSSIFRA